MGDAIFDLEQVLRSRKEKLTSQEANVLLEWRSNALRDFTVGTVGGSIVTWLATPRLANLLRINVTLGAAAACGFWRFGKSVESSVEHILSLEGTRIQRELGTIMLKKYRDNPGVLKRLSKHFYPEEVYEDSSLDKPVFRWRLRCTSGVPVENHSQSTPSYGEESDSKQNDVKNTSVDPKQVINAGGDSITVNNPFELMFGLPGNTENMPRPSVSNAPSTSPQRQSRKERRARRRRRRHHHEEEEEDSDI